MKRSWLVVFLVALFMPLLASAQHVHNGVAVASQQVIDGSKTPTKIPEHAAYRLWLIATAQASSVETDTFLLDARLQMIGLTPDDMPAARRILADFKTQCLQLVENYNKSLDVKHNSSAGYALFKTKQKALVKATMDQFNLDLSIGGRASIQDHVRSERQFMFVAAQEAE